MNNSKTFTPKQPQQVVKPLPVSTSDGPGREVIKMDIPITYNPFHQLPPKPSAYSSTSKPPVYVPPAKPLPPSTKVQSAPAKTITTPLDPRETPARNLRQLPDKIAPAKLEPFIKKDESPSGAIKRKLSGIDVTRSLKSPPEPFKPSIVSLCEIAQKYEDHFTEMWGVPDEPIPDTPVEDYLAQRISDLEKENAAIKEEYKNSALKINSLVSRLKTFKEAMQNAQMTISSLELTLNQTIQENQNLVEQINDLGNRHVEQSKQIALLKKYNNNK